MYVLHAGLPFASDCNFIPSSIVVQCKDMCSVQGYMRPWHEDVQQILAEAVLVVTDFVAMSLNTFVT